jgi:hypothetical protein
MARKSKPSKPAYCRKLSPEVDGAPRVRCTRPAGHVGAHFARRMVWYDRAEHVDGVAGWGHSRPRLRGRGNG